MFRATTVSLLSVAALLLAAGAAPSAEPDAKTAVGKALPLLLKGAEGHVAKRTCFACHNQGVPVLALTTARGRGFPLRDGDLKKQTKFIAAFLETNRDEYREGKGQGGQADTAGYALLTLELGGWKADATTEAVVEYLLLRDKDRGHWHTTSDRPPSETSDFTPTYLALRALRYWGTSDQEERIARRTDAAREWLSKAPTKDTEDRVFRLRGLREAGAADRQVRAAADELLRSQRKDGGWGQTGAMDSDAYATGTALVALHSAGGLATDDDAYRRGVAFLLKEQQADGSWLVRSRSKPFQTYYESGFPHGKDQFISMAASGWATTALALTLPLDKSAEEKPAVSATGKITINYHNGKHSHVTLEDSSGPYSGSTTIKSVTDGPGNVSWDFKILSWTKTQLRIRLKGKGPGKDKDKKDVPPTGDLTITLTSPDTISKITNPVYVDDDETP